MWTTRDNSTLYGVDLRLSCELPRNRHQSGRLNFPTIAEPYGVLRPLAWGKAMSGGEFGRYAAAFCAGVYRPRDGGAVHYPIDGIISGTRRVKRARHRHRPPRPALGTRESRLVGCVICVNRRHFCPVTSKVTEAFNKGIFESRDVL